MELGLAGRVVLVTGATGEIGTAIAEAFAGEGARVAVAYHHDKDAAAALASRLGGTAVPYDLADPDSPAGTFDAVAERLGPVEVLVANAMRWGRRRGPDERFEDVPPADWMPVITENLAPTIRTAQLAVGGMRKGGWGRIVLVSSHVATDGHRGQEFYGATKSGLHGFAKSLAWDAGQDGVLVNVVSPGLTLTRRVATGLPEAVRARETERTATGRLSRAADIAAAVVFLCSAANQNITGEVLTVAGGR
ncbi:SDR family oxidoreductase [Amycolatopsis acidicola]|uniref:SDR family oxidoreductase n=1 Tax=Amycolatopsis acidicola TaxID=2596893 RepID=A0A5N0VK24_9PSEU|nr:SDR family oxidoreductase [Amycolatopsis acidicola]KAA9166516.1 SDR family oxidoreductase [Amycolatopsis acidicola]